MFKKENGFNEKMSYWVPQKWWTRSSRQTFMAQHLLTAIFEFQAWEENPNQVTNDDADVDVDVDADADAFSFRLSVSLIVGFL